MNKFLILTIFLVLLFGPFTSFASSCAGSIPEKDVNNYDTLFIAFVTEGHFIEGDEPESCGWIEGSFEVIETLKGNPNSVIAVRQGLANCNGNVSSISDSFPIGKYILVKTNSEIAQISSCALVWSEFRPNCHVDAIQRLLNIEAADPVAREVCIAYENRKNSLYEASNLDTHIAFLEDILADKDRKIESLRNNIEREEEDRAEMELEIRKLKEER